MHPSRFRKNPVLAAVLLIAAFGAVTPAAAQWCGENGVFRLSFAEGDSLVPIAHRQPENGVTVVDLYGWLTDVEPVARDGEAFLAVGGFEFKLLVEGAEAFILEKNIPIRCLDMGKDKSECVVGLDPGLTIRDGKVNLVHWKVMFQGEPEDVVFRLDPEPGKSCGTVPGCTECRSPALYIGVEGSGMLTTFFGAAAQAAHLNPAGEPDLEPVRGECTYQDVGIFERR